MGKKWCGKVFIMRFLVPSFPVFHDKIIRKRQKPAHGRKGEKQKEVKLN